MWSKKYKKYIEVTCFYWNKYYQIWFKYSSEGLSVKGH